MYPSITRIVILSTLASIITATSVSAADPSVAEAKDSLILSHDGVSIAISTQSPRFAFRGQMVMPIPCMSFSGDGLFDGRTKEISYPPIDMRNGSQLDVVVMLKWSEREQLLRKWARFRISAREPLLLEELVLDEINLNGSKAWSYGDFSIIPDPVQSHPIFVPGFFTGIEFPISATRIENAKLILAHRPGVSVEPGKWYESRKAIYGVSDRGKEIETFERYIELNRPKPKGFHINYNSWWTSPVPFSEGDILNLMDVFRTNLCEPYNTSFDSFTIDMGWSDPKSIWEINKSLFPEGFSNLKQSAEEMGSNLGIWISPSSAYPAALDNEWAKEHGYEASFVDGKPQTLCLGGNRYASRFRDRLADMINKYHIRQVKLDGCWLTCNETNHGHEPGLLSSEKIAEGFIGACESMRKASRDVWLEPTCFGYNPSPWWLFYVNSLIGSFGDDAPYGRVPCPIYRESYTTARDYFNLQGASLLPIPISAQEVLGIVHQTNEPFMNDAVTSIMRGHMFQPVYMNPKYMNQSRWKSFADLLKWARKNSRLLAHTKPLLPKSWQSGSIPHFTDSESMPREPYGFAHCDGSKALIMLRNPWIARSSYTLKLNEELGLFEPGAGTKFSIMSIYPEARSYAKDTQFGDSIDILLAPYETVVLSISTKKLAASIPEASEKINNHISTAALQSELARVDFTNADNEAFGPNWTSLLGQSKSATKLILHGRVTSSADNNRLLLLIESNDDITSSACKVNINGEMVDVLQLPSAAGWAATLLPVPEKWLFMSADLPKGESSISAEMYVGGECKRLSGWVWASKAEPTPTKQPDMMPSPELISLDSACLFDFDSPSALNLPRISETLPVEQIDGVFLDALTPKSVSQGWGALQKNKSVWEKPLIIAGKYYRRGLGTHAISRIEYELDGKYRRFVAEAGVDGNNFGTVTFEVWVDGNKKWETGIMHRNDAAKLVDIDVTGARSLVLVVGDAGDGINGDHADWCNAMLLF